MGICLDTDQQDGSQVFDENGAQSTERWRREAGILATPPDGNFPMQNSGPVKFESPTVPVIFVLGGPGSGKVTHCDNLSKEKKGIVHINMTDLLQQYTLGNDMKNFALLSSKTVTEVLMLEMKMSPEAKTFLVSGYPRNMRDVVEYSEKIQIMNGVILIAWKQEVLEGQVEYGAQLGHVIMELARMELDNFFKHVMPVADYFEQSEMLLSVSGERDPTLVYMDFREAVMRILGLSDEGSAPPERHTSSSMEAEVEVVRDQEGREPSPTPTEERIIPPPPSESPPPPMTGDDETLPSRTLQAPRKRLPPIVWVMGGPGSNKAMICSMAVRKMPNWIHLSMGSLLQAQAANSPMIREALVSGELVPTEMVELILEKQILLNRNRSGIVIDGYPRDITQAQAFENKFGQQPEILLLDVSKNQPSRGRMYDGPNAFYRRLELFRELTMPILKSLDIDKRLTMLDGDTELPSDRQQFASALLELMRRAARHEDDPNRISVLTEDEDSNIEDYTQPPQQQPIKTRQAAPNGVAKPVANGVGHRNPAVVGNGAAGTGRGRQPGLANGSVPSKAGNRKTSNNNNRQTQQQQNGQQKKSTSTTTTRKQQSQMNGGPHLIQNGVPARMANGRVGNGFLPNKTNNRVAPAIASTASTAAIIGGRNNQNGIADNSLRRMYAEIDDRYDFPPTNLHM